MVGSFYMAPTPRIHFGAGKIQLLPELIKQYGNKVLLLTGARTFSASAYWPQLQHALSSKGITCYRHLIPREPSPEMIDSCVEAFQDKGVPLVVAIGGGSVMDAGKAVSAMLTCTHSVKSYLEGVGDLSPTGTTIPFIAVPTTAGTGSEATKNAVLSEVGKTGFKKSLRHENYVPDIALIDPELALGTPAAITAASGMDAFTQLLESYHSSKGNPMTDALALDGLSYIRNGLLQAIANPNDLPARESMAYAALLSGITLANAGLGLVHGFASSVGAQINIPHGALCGTLMGIVNRLSVEQILRDKSHPEVLTKYALVGRLFGSESQDDLSAAQFLIDLIDEWIEQVKLPRLSVYGLTEEMIPEIAQQTNLKNHPIELGKELMEEMLRTRL